MCQPIPVEHPSKASRVFLWVLATYRESGDLFNLQPAQQPTQILVAHSWFGALGGPPRGTNDIIHGMGIWKFLVDERHLAKTCSIERIWGYTKTGTLLQLDGSLPSLGVVASFRSADVGKTQSQQSQEQAQPKDVRDWPSTNLQADEPRCAPRHLTG